MSAIQFPSSKDFDAKATTGTAALETKKWSDLSIGIYAITELKSVKGKYGESFIGDLETQGGDQYKAWLPQRLGAELQGIKLPVFVRHEGLQQSKKNKSRQYYAYTLM